jgi:hypothetical protein
MLKIIKDKNPSAKVTLKMALRPRAVKKERMEERKN